MIQTLGRARRPAPVWLSPFTQGRELLFGQICRLQDDFLFHAHGQHFPGGFPSVLSDTKLSSLGDAKLSSLNETFFTAFFATLFATFLETFLKTFFQSFLTPVIC